jgi:hypothetical protein
MDTVSGSVSAGATTSAALPTMPGISQPFLDLSFFTLSTLTSWSSLATIFGLYVVLCWSLRFRHEKAMLRRFKYTDRASLANMTNDDASEILKSLIVYEFPKLYHASLQFAIFKVSHETSINKPRSCTD